MKDDNKQIIIDEEGNKNNCDQQFPSKNMTNRRDSYSNQSLDSEKKEKNKKSSESESSVEDKNLEIEFNENDDTIAIEEQIKENIIQDTSHKNIEIKKEIENSSHNIECISSKHESKSSNLEDKDKNEGDNYYKPVSFRKNEGILLFKLESSFSNNSMCNEGGYVMSFLDPKKDYLKPAKSGSTSKYDQKSKLDLKKKENYVQLDYTTRTDSNNNKILEIISTQNRGGYENIEGDSIDQSNMPQNNESYQEGDKNQIEIENMKKKEIDKDKVEKLTKKITDFYEANKKIFISLFLVISLVIMLLILRI